MKNKNSLENKISYEDEIYRSIPTMDLLVFGIGSIINGGGKSTFEKIIEECFNLFPKSFGFSRHPEWPDSLKFDRQLRTLREKGLITGSPKTSFFLTKFGEKVAENVKIILKKGVTPKKELFKIFRDADINLVNYLKISKIFQRFKKNKKNFSFTEMELRNLLYCTLETPQRIVKQNIIYAKNLAQEFKEELLFEFLELCYKKFKK